MRSLEKIVKNSFWFSVVLTIGYLFSVYQYFVNTLKVIQTPENFVTLRAIITMGIGAYPFFIFMFSGKFVYSMQYNFKTLNEHKAEVRLILYVSILSMYARVAISAFLGTLTLKKFMFEIPGSTAILTIIISPIVLTYIILDKYYLEDKMAKRVLKFIFPIKLRKKESIKWE